MFLNGLCNYTFRLKVVRNKKCLEISKYRARGFKKSGQNNLQDSKNFKRRLVQSKSSKSLEQYLL